MPKLWRFHRVHHSDTHLDVATTVRFHPVEFLVNLPMMLAVIALFGIPPVALMIYEIMDAAMNVFTHANVRLPKWADRVVRVLFVTPDMHRVHHSSWHRETDSNYGATLSIWDHLFGTFRAKEPEALATMEIGLREVRDGRANSLWWLLALPFRPIRIPQTQAETEIKEAA
jgi:sterol desaturase/sphingolipid hydroxylase (fatty acid hydroxylase superfamily)